MKKGELICEVKFGIDINQILKINASVAVNGEKNGIIIANDEQFKDNKKIIFEDINNIEIDLNEVQKKIKIKYYRYNKKF
jgi:molecular chaperone DnaK (HSP70)